MNQPEFDLGMEPVLPKQKPRNIIMDALAIGCGLELNQITRSARSAIAKSAAEIRQVKPDVTPADIERAISVYRVKHPTWSLTPPSIAKYWPEISRAPAASSLPENVRHALQNSGTLIAAHA